MGALLALASALGWGVGDFVAGIASRRLAVLTVLVISQAVGLMGVSIWVLLSGDAFPGIEALAPAGVGGIAALVGLGALYRGFAVGAMGIVAPISAASPIVPLAVDGARGEVPSAPQWFGVALVVTGIVALSWESASGGRRRMAAGAGLAVVAALGFGLFFVGIDAGADESAAWAVMTARAASVPVAVLAALATAAPLTAPRRMLPLLVTVGVFDTGANVLAAEATTYGAVGIVAVLSSLYPIVTVVLAWRVLGERLSVGKRIGGAVALTGAALVAAG
jgi:drug/metabolite transporter (DMT)-like permease